MGVINMTIGEKIRMYREYRGYNQIELAKVSGINVGTIRKYELGIRNPKPDQLKKIADGLMLSESIFYEFDISTVGDVASLFFMLDNAVEFEFYGAKNDGKYDANSVCLKFKDSFLKKFMAEWATLKEKTDEIRNEANDVTNEESKTAVIERADELYNKYKTGAVDSPYIVKKGTEGISVRNYTAPTED
jgi:transcriptional regulator with XRE-family HTH domain